MLAPELRLVGEHTHTCSPILSVTIATSELLVRCQALRHLLLLLLLLQFKLQCQLVLQLLRRCRTATLHCCPARPMTHSHVAPNAPLLLPPSPLLLLVLALLRATGCSLLALLAVRFCICKPACFMGGLVYKRTQRHFWLILSCPTTCESVDVDVGLTQMGDISDAFCYRSCCSLPLLAAARRSLLLRAVSVCCFLLLLSAACCCLLLLAAAGWLWAGASARLCAQGRA